MGEAKKKNSSIDFRTLTMVLVLVLLWVAFTATTGGNFLTTRNLSNLIRQAAFTGIMGVGMTLVIVTGGIDLSVGSVLALSTVLCAGMITSGVPAGAAMIAALIIGTALGLVSGVLVTKGRLQPFIATLITMTVYRGLTMIFHYSSCCNGFAKVIQDQSSPYFLSDIIRFF